MHVSTKSFVDTSILKPSGAIKVPRQDAYSKGAHGASVGLALHDEQRRLAMVDLGEHRRTGLDLLVVDHRLERFAARFHERGLDLARHALERRIRHGEPDIGPRQIGQPVHVKRVAGRHHAALPKMILTADRHSCHVLTRLGPPN